MKKERGFSLIELVMVIIILAILAATALPKFANLQSNSRMSSLQTALDAVKSASTMAHSASLAESNNTVSIDGTNYAMVNTFPNETDIARLANLSSSDYNFANTSNTLTVTLGTCSFTYTNATVADSAPEISVISGANINGGC